MNIQINGLIQATASFQLDLSEVNILKDTISKLLDIAEKENKTMGNRDKRRITRANMEEVTDFRDALEEVKLGLIAQNGTV